MAKITFMVPYPEICDEIQQVFEEQNDGNWTIELIVVDGVPRQIDYKKIKADVVVARGISASVAQAFLNDVPIIRLPVSGYDVMRAALECKKLYDSHQIAIVGSEDMIYGARSIQELTGIEIITKIVNSEDETEERLINLKKENINVIIGGQVSTRIATRLDMRAVMICSGREAIYQAFSEAKRVFFIRMHEQERSERFRTFIDYSVEGIVAVNDRGKIDLINAAATQIVSLRGKIDGKMADEVLPELGLGRVLATGAAEIGEIRNVGGQQVIINSAPIAVNGNTVGAIATFQPIHNIQELEGRIRQKIYDRGHVAKHSFSDIYGESDKIRRAVAVAKEYSKVDSNVLIVGETGSGKEVFAQSIHTASARSLGPFVAFNCAALPENLLESELFGYVGGAFSGAAKEGKAGLFEVAHQGTIFLDEISEISIKMQGRLLRVLQEREIMRLGDRRIIPVDVRVIAATNRHLGTMIQKGDFRSDLFYRLDILELIVPPLRERVGDVYLLFDHFLHINSVRFKKPHKTILPAARERLEEYPWPGNVRELMNLAERLTVIGSSEIIEEESLVYAFNQINCAMFDGNLNRSKSLKEPARTSRKLNQTVLLQALQENGYHYSKAAAKLGISRTTLWNWLKEIDSEQNEQNEQ
jgi:transcriptional regulator with PAS, ATPase and Fis domain